MSHALVQAMQSHEYKKDITVDGTRYFVEYSDYPADWEQDLEVNAVSIYDGSNAILLNMEHLCGSFIRVLEQKIKEDNEE